MPPPTRPITEIAQDFAEGSELAAAITAGAKIAPTQDRLREPWVRRWLELSQWARERELRELEREMNGALEELRQSEQATVEHFDALFASTVYADAHFRQCVADQCGPDGVNEISSLLGEVTTLRQDAIEALLVATAARIDHTNAKSAISLSRLRGEVARRHFVELRRVRIRTSALTFLLTLVAMVSAAILMRYCTHLPTLLAP